MSFVTELYKKTDDNANIDYRAPNQKGRRVCRMADEYLQENLLWHDALKIAHKLYYVKFN